jgi:hypothetical protein
VQLTDLPHPNGAITLARHGHAELGPVWLRVFAAVLRANGAR